MSKHVENQCTKATKALGFVRRATLNIKNIAVRRTLYLSLVRSQLCYGSQICAPQTVTLIKQAERTQRRATKYVLDLPFRCDTIYHQRLLLLDLIPLCYWHEFLDIVLFYKLIHGHVSIDTNLLPSTTNNNRREIRSSDTDHLKFSTNRCNTTTYQRSYLNRTTRLWNILPKELTGINTSLKEQCHRTRISSAHMHQLEKTGCFFKLNKSKMATVNVGAHGGKRDNSGRKRKYKGSENFSNQNRRVYLSLNVFLAWREAKNKAGYQRCSDSDFASHLLSLEYRIR